MVKTKRRWAFGMVSTALQIGHAVVAAGAVGAAMLVVLHFSGMPWSLGRWLLPARLAVAAVPCLHVLLMLVMPVWSGMAARAKPGASRLWAWLGYLVPLAGYWMPAKILGGLVSGQTPEDARLRTLIRLWGVARGLAAPSAIIALILLLFTLDRAGKVTAGVFVVYMIVTLLAANGLSFVVVSRMQRYLATTAVDARQAEVFA